MNIFQNELEATTSGAVFVNGGGNVTIENNVILNGKASQILIYSYNRNASEYGCPGTQILRNIFQFSETALDASRSGWSNGPVRAYGGHFMSPAQHLVCVSFPAPLPMQITTRSGTKGLDRQGRRLVLCLGAWVYLR